MNTEGNIFMLTAKRGKAKVFKTLLDGVCPTDVTSYHKVLLKSDKICVFRLKVDLGTDWQTLKKNKNPKHNKCSD